MIRYLTLAALLLCACSRHVVAAAPVPPPPPPINPTPTYADALSSTQDVVDAVAEDPGGTCESLILQWPKTPDGQDGQTLLYREAGCDLCVMTCIAVVQGTVDEDSWKREPASALQAVADCIKTHCRAARAEVIP